MENRMERQIYMEDFSLNGMEDFCSGMEDNLPYFHTNSITSKSMALAISHSIESTDKLLSLSCAIVDLKYVLISFSFEKLLSPDATVIGIVK